jgi:carbon monoxide dehydrogenase subunit G
MSGSSILRRARAGLAVLIAGLLWAAYACAAAPPKEQDLSVVARKQGDTITVQTSAYIPVPPEEAWTVLTDFDHMAGIIEGLESSRIVGRNGDKLLVRQKGHATTGPLSFSFESLREIELKPYVEMRGHLISGTMKKSEGVTRLAPEGSGTRLTSTGEFIPDIWVPPLIGVKIIEIETRRQFDGLRREIIRRNQVKASPGPPESNVLPGE